MKKLGMFVCAFVAAGCVASESIDLTTPDAGGQPITVTTGAGGQSGAPGQAGAAGLATSGGAGASSAGASGTAGAAGGASGAGTAGAAGTSSQGGRGGSTNDAGATGGQGSSFDARPASDGGGAEVSAYAATWTDIYNKMLNNPSYASNCTGGACHNPGTQKGLDFSTQAKGYTTVKAKLVVGNPGASSIVNQLSSGKMPQARPKMPAVDLNVIKAWIMAGAPNN
jgi:hypothetical protein